MDLETNATKGLARENSLTLEPGAVPDSAVVKMAQTFRSGTNDIDAIDFVDMFLEDEDQTSLDDLNELYVLVNFRPAVTNKNWRMDCGVAGYDNTFGLPPFFPTRLRFEDYIYRLWIQQDGIVAAHVDAAQNHTKSNYMRNPLAAEIFNEEVSNLLKRKIKDSVTRVDELSIEFDYDGEVTGADAREILDKIAALHGRALAAAAHTANPERAQALRLFAANLQKAFYGFEPDFFQQNLLRIVDDVVGVIKGSIQLWPTLVEIATSRSGGAASPKPSSQIKGSSHMRIAQVAPLFESVPPKLYGGTERVVSYLTEELVRRGHEVTLFASGDSETSARLVPGCERALWRDPECRETLPHHVRLMELVFREARPFRRHPFSLRLRPLSRAPLPPDADRHDAARHATTA